LLLNNVDARFDRMALPEKAKEMVYTRPEIFIGNIYI
jgi:hypothetical protein